MSEHLGVEPNVLREYGAFDTSVISDLPVFIDPFLLFNSEKPEYQELHEGILAYLRFLRDKAAPGDLPKGLINNWYRFKEVKQTWLGFTVIGNEGRGLGRDFANALHDSLGSILSNFGSEDVPSTSHLEKVGLLQPNTGRDSISDFTTNLIKEYLCDYTEQFAKSHVADSKCSIFRVPRVCFNYETESWQEKSYYLPALWGDFVLLTPIDMLTRDDTWISRDDMFKRFAEIPLAMPNEELRDQVSNYLAQALRPVEDPRRKRPRPPTAKERNAAIEATIRRFPEVLDYYIKLQEDAGDQATETSRQKVEDTLKVFVQHLHAVINDLEARTDFYHRSWSSYDEALARAKAFKHYVEHQDGWRVINRKGQPFAKEAEVQLFFGIIWFGSAFDVNREANNGRGPVDFKVSIGAKDKALIEFKLASNTKLKRNLERQAAIYEEANQTSSSVKVIICYTEFEQFKVAEIVKELGLEGHEDIIVIDARSDNKPSGSVA